MIQYIILSLVLLLYKTITIIISNYIKLGLGYVVCLSLSLSQGFGLLKS